MKTLRSFPFVLLAVLVLSIWSPAPVYAQPARADSKTTVTLILDPAKAKLAKLRVNNRTGGTLFVNLSGDRSYSFSTSKQGKTRFDAVIEPGKYTLTVRASACSGQLTLKRKVKGGTVSLPPISCRG